MDSCLKVLLMFRRGLMCCLCLRRSCALQRRRGAMRRLRVSQLASQTTGQRGNRWDGGAASAAGQTTGDLQGRTGVAEHIRPKWEREGRWNGRLNASPEARAVPVALALVLPLDGVNVKKNVSRVCFLSDIESDIKLLGFICALQLYEVFLEGLPGESISIIPTLDYPTVAFTSLYSGAYHIKSAGHIMVTYLL